MTTNPESTLPEGEDNADDVETDPEEPNPARPDLPESPQAEPETTRPD